MGWLIEIKNYVPNLKQEENAKRMIIENFEKSGNILTRENTEGHLTSSGFIINKSGTKTLMIHHNIYKAWTWTGGHADGESDLFQVALREAKEETGLKNIYALNRNIASLDVIPVKEHTKNGKIVEEHLHFSVAYILVADEFEEYSIKQDENSDIKWISMEKISEYTWNEPHMQEIYKKILNKVAEYL